MSEPVIIGPTAGAIYEFDICGSCGLPIPPAVPSAEFVWAIKLNPICKCDLFKIGEISEVTLQMQPEALAGQRELEF